MAKVGELVLELVVDAKKGTATIKNFTEVVEKTTQQASQNVEQMRSRFQRVAEAGQRLFFAFQGFKLLAAPMGNLIALANEQEKAEQKVAQAVRSTGMAAGFSAQQLKEMAAELQKTTVFGDEEILNKVTAQLLTFTNITGENFKKTQEAALNLATVLDGDLQSAAIMLGKALNDPVSNLGALSRAGIQFSDEQEKLIKSLWEAGKAAEAQAIILQELERQYGGQARAMAQTAAGQMRQFANLLGDFKEKLGDLLKNLLVPLLNMGSKLLTWMNQLSPSTLQLIGMLSGLLAVVLKLSPAFRAWILNIRILGITIQTAMGWIGILVAAATLLYTAWSSNLFGIRDKLKIFWEYVKTVFQSIWLLVKDVGSRLLAYFESVFNFWKNILKGNFNEAINAAQNAKEAIVGNWDETLNRIGTLWEQNRQRIQAIQQAKETDEQTHQEAIFNIQKTAAQQSIQIEQDKYKALQTLQQLRIANIKDEFARRRAEVELWFQQEKAKWAGNAEIIAELERQKQLRLTQIERDEEQRRLEIQRRIRDLRIQAIQDEFQRRKAMIEAWAEDEIARAQGNADLIAAIEAAKQQKLLQLQQQYAEQQKTIQQEKNAAIQAMDQAVVDGFSNAYDTLLQHMVSGTQLTTQNLNQLWDSMKKKYVSQLGSMLKEYIQNKIKEKVVFTTTEKTKTAVKKSETATQTAIGIGGMVKESLQALKNIGVWIGNMVAKLFSWFASLGPFGIIAGVGVIAGLVSMVRAVIRSVMKFEKGGIVTKQTIGLIGEAGDTEAVIPLNQQGARFMAQLLPKIVVPAAVDTSRLRMEKMISRMESTIANLKLSAHFDADQLAIIVENGQATLGDFEF